MNSYIYSGFVIMVLDDIKCRLPRNFFVIDRAFFGDISLPPPPKHFRYAKEEERYRLCYYKLIVDKNDPPPPPSLLRLSKMPIKTLKSIASRNDLRGWAGLSKIDLVKFLVRHRYIFSDDFYKQRSLPNQIRAWVELFADNNFAKHYTEIMLNTLTKSGYYKPTNQIEYYCWWKGLLIANVNKKNLFFSGPNSFLVFEREMDVRIRKLIKDVRESLRVIQSEDASNFWTQEWRRKWKVMLKKINEIGVVWSEEEKDLFFSQLKERLVKKVLQIGDAYVFVFKKLLN